MDDDPAASVDRLVRRDAADVDDVGVVSFVTERARHEPGTET